mmetsp:Transcript_23226/g.24735  ORF Transcript_23226/g.24735 Transcript_23226/m.24735 type:complete len:480 (+) Transcript_23226:43-1482(+)
MDLISVKDKNASIIYRQRLNKSNIVSLSIVTFFKLLFVATTTVIRHYSVGAFNPYTTSMTSRHNHNSNNDDHQSSPRKYSSDKRRYGGNINAPHQHEEEHQTFNSQHHQTKKKKNERQREVTTTDAAPMYITIGPQCCGKSSFLRNLEGGKIKDVCLDDQPDVYVKVSTDILVHACDKKDNDNDNHNGKIEKQKQQLYHGKLLSERIRENVELILILRRWNGDLKAVDFERKIQKYYQERNLSLDVAKALITATEKFLSTSSPSNKSPQMPRQTDVFILESLFKPHPQTRQSAIVRAQEELRKTPKHIPIAWGNTNSKPRDYERVLEICHQTKRSVHFVLCHPEYSSYDGGSLLTLPWVPFDNLLMRNLQRLQSQGRYIPANAIADCCRRITALVPPNSPTDSNLNPNNVEQFLVGLASPSTNGRNNPHQNRQRNDSNRTGVNFRYILTKDRLINKQYPRQNNNQQNNNTARRRNDYYK